MSSRVLYYNILLVLANFRPRVGCFAIRAAARVGVIVVFFINNLITEKKSVFFLVR